MPSANHPAPSYLAARGRPHSISSLAVFGAKGDATVAVSGKQWRALRTTAIAGQGLAYLPTFIVA